MTLRMEFTVVPKVIMAPDQGDLGEGYGLEARLVDALERNMRAEVAAVLRLLLDVATPGDEALCGSLLTGVDLSVARDDLACTIEWCEGYIDPYLTYLGSKGNQGVVLPNPEVTNLAAQFLETNDDQTRRRILAEARAMLAAGPLVHEPYDKGPDGGQATLKDFIALATVLVHCENVVDLDPDCWADHLRASDFHQLTIFNHTATDDYSRGVAHRASLGPPLHVRLAIGLMARNEIPIPADWLVAWRLGSSERSNWVPARRLDSKYRRLFAQRLAPTHPDGLRLAVPANAPAILQLWEIAGTSYSVRFPDVQEATIGGVGYGFPPEFAALEELFRGCANDLSPLSRLLGRKPAAWRTDEARALLPQNLLAPEFVMLLQQFQLYHERARQE
jgi:hypothetical protein